MVADVESSGLIVEDRSGELEVNEVLGSNGGRIVASPGRSERESNLWNQNGQSMDKEQRDTLDASK